LASPPNLTKTSPSTPTQQKIKQRLHYFGPWADPQAALEKYLAVKDDLLAGRTPRPKTEGATLRDLANKFLTAKKHLAETGEIALRTYADYHFDHLPTKCIGGLLCIGRSRAGPKAKDQQDGNPQRTPRNQVKRHERDCSLPCDKGKRPPQENSRFSRNRPETQL
jgi:hypothetical protein